MTHTPSVLFVCTGNICRSPTAHALLLHKAAALQWDVRVDSAAVTGEEIGNPPDPRALTELKRRGVAMPAHRARRVVPSDFTDYDLVLGMTASHVHALRRMATNAEEKIGLLMDFTEDAKGVDVPDPWYGSAKDFAHAFDMIEHGIDGVIHRLRSLDAGNATTAES
ncbi:low molecular weight protein-tyrosine-phosphatase [Luteibacter sp. ME-Dv--P-043b]|uniref:low molecular weight protein-tyrosine-phosphatase n=1 Tax=Luteibacter sp. ME-Dv--P-043b TaxID=3040291 RepID=UPI002555356A|nr:low molecular weight protein-tyrosine-phosphatase [Luteibacter sp. ME-Dv--P-043b]